MCRTDKVTPRVFLLSILAERLFADDIKRSNGRLTMSFKTLMIIKAVVCLVLGVPILLATTFFYSVFGASLNDAGVFAAREYGASLIGNLMITWFARNAIESQARQAITLGYCIYDAIGFVVTLIAQLSGVLGPMGWVAVVIYLFFALAFGYYLLPQKQAVQRPATGH